MPESTYEVIATVQVTTATGFVTFANIPQNFNDLVCFYKGQLSTGNDVTFQYNGDSSTSYSGVRIYGDGTSVYSDAGNNESVHAFTIGGSGSPGQGILNLNNYNNNHSFKTTFVRPVNIDAYVGMVGQLYKKTAPIKSITFIASGTTNFNVGTTFSLYGVTAAGLKAIGGDIVQTDGTYWYHAFMKSGTFTPLASMTCDYLVVAGGGGGGGNNTGPGAVGGGGGGAGGLRSTVTATGGGGSLETALSLTAQAYTVTIGAGGAGGSGATNGGERGASGSNSVFSSITSTGGGGGGSIYINVGATGGSGGGSYFNAAGGAGTANQGFAGGAGATGATYRAGGGGGAGAAALAANNNVPNGGAGVTISAFASPTATGVNTVYAGGGGGGSYIGDAGAGGTGGGGAGAKNNSGGGDFAVPNTGGGGGGAGYTVTSTDGGNGGSGLVIVRYLV